MTEKTEKDPSRWRVLRTLLRGPVFAAVPRIGPGGRVGGCDYRDPIRRASPSPPPAPELPGPRSLPFAIIAGPGAFFSGEGGRGYSEVRS